MKYLLVILVVGLVLWLMLGRRRVDAPAPRAKEPPAASSEGMVRCVHCGVHLPRSEAVQSQGLTYCSTAHLKAGPRTTD